MLKRIIHIQLFLLTIYIIQMIIFKKKGHLFNRTIFTFKNSSITNFLTFTFTYSSSILSILKTWLLRLPINFTTSSHLAAYIVQAKERQTRVPRPVNKPSDYLHVLFSPFLLFSFSLSFFRVLFRDSLHSYLVGSAVVARGRRDKGRRGQGVASEQRERERKRRRASE